METSMPLPWQQPLGYIVRHGTTDLNDADCYRGWQNPVLNEEGREAAQAAANFFSYEALGRIITSDLDRAIETADYIMQSGCIECPYLSPDFNLRPWNIGNFAGKEKTAETKKKLQRYIEDPELKIPDGESLNEFRQRNSIILEYLSVPFNGKPTVIVAHTSNVSALHNLLDPEDAYNEESKDVVEPGGIVAVYQKPDGTMYLVPRLGEASTEGQVEAS